MPLAGDYVDKPEVSELRLHAHLSADRKSVTVLVGACTSGLTGTASTCTVNVRTASGGTPFRLPATALLDPAETRPLPAGTAAAPLSTTGIGRSLMRRRTFLQVTRRRGY
jgi:hypothetical protein